MRTRQPCCPSLDPGPVLDPARRDTGHRRLGRGPTPTTGLGHRPMLSDIRARRRWRHVEHLVATHTENLRVRQTLPAPGAHRRGHCVQWSGLSFSAWSLSAWSVVCRTPCPARSTSTMSRHTSWQSVPVRTSTCADRAGCWEASASARPNPVVHTTTPVIPVAVNANRSLTICRRRSGSGEGVLLGVLAGARGDAVVHQSLQRVVDRAGGSVNTLPIVFGLNLPTFSRR